MNIAIFASAFYPHVGGVEELVRQLTREYAARGLECIVVTNRWPRDLPEYELFEGIPVYRLPLRVPEGSRTAPMTFAVTRSAVHRAVVRVLRRHAIELIHVQCVSANGHYARLAADELQLPLIVTSQGERLMDATSVYDRSRFLNITLLSVLARADGVTACSHAVLRDLEGYSGISLGARGRVIYNGVATDDFAAASVAPYRHVRPYVLALGRCVPQKGFEFLLRAFAAAIRRDEFDHDLLLAGDGPELPRLAAQIDDASLAGRAHLLGVADRKTVVNLYQGCSFFVLPSRYEPLGIVNLEAMAAGRAVVATRVGGVPEIIADGENGLLVEYDDVNSLTEALLRLANDPDLRGALGRRGRSAASRFAWPRIADQYLAFYRSQTELVGAHGGQS